MDDSKIDPAALPPLGASVEVLEYHMAIHRQQCPGLGRITKVCDHGTTMLLCCGSCNQPVFMAVLPDTWCSHAAEIKP